jgi:hypothetical protein
VTSPNTAPQGVSTVVSLPKNWQILGDQAVASLATISDCTASHIGLAVITVSPNYPSMDFATSRSLNISLQPNQLAEMEQ